MKRIFFLLILLVSTTTNAQIALSGEIRDGISHRPLQFASIRTLKNQSFLTDSNGKFNISIGADHTFIYLSYAGYQTQKVDITTKKYFSIFLLPSNDAKSQKPFLKNLQASDIILQTILRKNNNSFLKNNKNFTFKSYNKLIVSADPDSISSKIDTIYHYKNSIQTLKKIDSTSYIFKKIVSKQHLFETEKASFFQFKNGKLQETILGSKMAGFKQPIFEVLGFSLQSFSIYDNEYTLLNSKYKSPVSKNAHRNFNYKLLDTATIDGRKMYIVLFANKKKKVSFDGVLYIDKENFAIARAIMHTKGILELAGYHEFTYLKNEKTWFPTKNTFKLSKGKNNKDINILGGTIRFDSDLEINFKPRKKEPSDFVFLISETTNDQIFFDQINNISKPNVSILLADDASSKSTAFWDQFRKIDLDNRSRQTYLFLDSISVKRRFEKKVVFGRKIINGFIPVGKFDFDLRKLANFNNYEGFRLCVAAVSNEYFSRKLRIEGYVAYGSKDGNFKYNFGSAIRIGSKSSSWVGLSYTDDIHEIASTTFAVENRQFKLFDSSLFNISSFYKNISWKGFIETNIIPKTASIWELSNDIIDPKFDYTFLANDKKYRSFKLTTAQISLQWSPFSRYMQTPNGLLEIEKKFPKFTFQLNKSLPKTLKNDFDFSKIDFKTEHEVKYIDGQVTNIIFAIGYAIGDVPLTHLYNNSPNSLNKDNLLQRATIDGENDFETMYYNEFFSNQYAFFQFKHEFKSFELSPAIKPNLVLIFRTAIGNLTNPEQHFGIQYKTLKDGYMESGIQLNKIFKGIGLGAFYRFGPNHLPKFDDNLAIRFSYKLDIGF